MPPHGKILARTQGTQAFSSDDAEYMLTTRLEVTKARSAGQVLKSAIWYEARFSLKEEGAGRGKNVGHLYAYMVDKTELDEQNKPLWLSEILAPHADRSELQSVLQELYTAAGTVKKRLRSYSEELRQDRIIFIDGLVLDAKFRGKGLSKVVMEAFHHLLPALAGPYAYTGAVVLSPAAAEDQEIKEGKTVVDVENGLIRSYERVGYKVWLKGDGHVADSVTVMGRFVEEHDGDEMEVDE